MSANRDRRDQRRREELKRMRKRGGRPPGETCVRSHKRRFEAALWLAFADHLKVRTTDAGRLTMVLLHLEAPFDLRDLDHGYASLTGRYIYPDLDDRYHDMQKTARLLQARSKGQPKDDDWLHWSQISLVILLLAPALSEAAFAAIAELQRLGWVDQLEKMRARLAKVPANLIQADPSLTAQFLTAAKRRGFHPDQNHHAKSAS